MASTHVAREGRTPGRARVPVVLRPLTFADQTEFIECAVRSKQLHAPWVSPPDTPLAYLNFLARFDNATNIGFTVRRLDTQALAGFIAMTNIVKGAFQSAYLGYYAFAGHERQRLMQAALSLAVRHAFVDLKLHRLEANIQPANGASIALVSSCGFSLEGYSPRYLKIRGRWRDHERWAILAG